MFIYVVVSQTSWVDNRNGAVSAESWWLTIVATGSGNTSRCRTTALLRHQSQLLRQHRGTIEKATCLARRKDATRSAAHLRGSHRRGTVRPRRRWTTLSWCRRRPNSPWSRRTTRSGCKSHSAPCFPPEMMHRRSPHLDRRLESSSPLLAATSLHRLTATSG